MARGNFGHTQFSVRIKIVDYIYDEKALEVMKALTLAGNYEEWIASNAVKPPNTRSASASRASLKQSKCIPLGVGRIHIQ